MLITPDPVVGLYELFKIYVAPLSIISTLLLLAWRIRGFVDTLVNNHLVHAKQEIIDAVKESAVLEDDGHKKIIDAIVNTSAVEKEIESDRHDKMVDAVQLAQDARAVVALKTQDNHEKLIDAITGGNDRIINTLIMLLKK